MKRYVRNNYGEFVAEYDVLDNEERKVYYNGEEMTGEVLQNDSELCNYISNVIDEFEEGFNNISYYFGDWYEVLHKWNNFGIGTIIARKVAGVKWYETPASVCTADKETGTRIELFETLSQAKNAIAEYEKKPSKKVYMSPIFTM